MSDQHKIFFIVAGLFTVALIMGFRPSIPAPTLAAEPAHPNSAQIGMSGTLYAGGPAPRDLIRNVPLMFPPPLAHMLPRASSATAGA